MVNTNGDREEDEEDEEEEEEEEEEEGAAEEREEDYIESGLGEASEVVGLLKEEEE